MKRASYREAIRWMAYNDDAEWTKDDFPPLSVTAALVADLFGVDDLKVTNDLRRELRKRK